MPQHRYIWWLSEDPTADHPALLGGPSAVHPANPPETKTSLDNFLDPTADCPLSHSGLSTVQLCKPTRDDIVSGQISSSTADCPHSNSRPSAVLFYGTTRDNIVSGQILSWPADCPAPWADRPRLLSLTPRTRRQRARRRWRRSLTDASDTQRKGNRG